MADPGSIPNFFFVRPPRSGPRAQANEDSGPSVAGAIGKGLARGVVDSGAGIGCGIAGGILGSAIGPWGTAGGAALGAFLCAGGADAGMQEVLDGKVAWDEAALTGVFAGVFAGAGVVANETWQTTNTVIKVSKALGDAGKAGVATRAAVSVGHGMVMRGTHAALNGDDVVAAVVDPEGIALNLATGELSFRAGSWAARPVSTKVPLSPPEEPVLELSDHFDTGVNQRFADAKLQGGVNLSDLPPGTRLDVTTRSGTRYVVVALADRKILIASDGSRFPTPTPGTVNATWGGSMAMPNQIMRGMRMEIGAAGRSAPLLTSPVEDVFETPPSPIKIMGARLGVKPSMKPK